MAAFAASQQGRDIDPMLVQCWASVADGGPALYQHLVNVSCLLVVKSSGAILRKMAGNKKWNESGFRPPLCTYRLNWARRTSWGWWDDCDDTVLQTQDSKFEPWRSEAEHATSRSRRLPTILTFTRGWGRNIFVSFKPPRPGTEPRTLAWKAAVLTTTLGPPPRNEIIMNNRIITLQTRDVDPILVYCWPNVYDAVPTLNQHWVSVSCLLGTRRLGIVTTIQLER